MKEATLIFPNQLYDPHPASRKDRLHVLIETTRFFDDHHNTVKHHKQKMMLHRASMKYYQREVLEKRGIRCEYIDCGDAQHLYAVLDSYLAQGLESVHMVDANDMALEEQARQWCEAHNIKLMIYETPGFITPKIDIEKFFRNRRPRPLDFYMMQRKRLGILMKDENEPIGGKWVLKEKPLKLPEKPQMPSIKRFRSNPYVDEARIYVERKFPDHPGMTADFIYPINAEEANGWLDNFLETRFADFSSQNAWIVDGHRFACHSLISAPLNIGLITPMRILERVNSFIRTHEVPLDSIEAFVRHIIGTREFARAAYLMLGNRLRSINFFMHNRRLSPMWWGMESGIPPLDNALAGVAEHAYCSNSERRMILGNIMLMCEVNPDDVFRWFLGMFIDAYDWSAVPNVYGISQFAGGGLIAAKPRLYTAKRILAISNYRKGPWCETWDGLFWRFIDRHTMLLGRSKALSPYIKQFKAMPRKERSRLIREGEWFIEKATR